MAKPRPRYDRIVYIEDYPYLNNLMHLFRELRGLTEGTFMAVFNTKAHQRRMIGKRNVHKAICMRVARIIGPGKKFCFQLDHGSRVNFIVMWKEDDE